MWRLLACAGAPDPVDPGPAWYDDLSFAPTCEAVTIGLHAEGEGWSADPEVAPTCDGLPTDAQSAAVDEVATACVGAGCPAVSSVLADELARLFARATVDTMTFDPVDPDALSTAGSDAELTIAFADGSGETWSPRLEVAWGERYVHLGPDGALDAQGSRITQPSGPCAAVRDHAMSGGLDPFLVDVREDNALDCGPARIQLDYTQRIRQ